MMAAPKLSPDAAPVAREVHRRMLARGMNKKQLADYSGLGETYVHDIFRGKSKNPKTEHLEKLASALGCKITDLTHPVVTSNGPETLDVIDPSGILPLLPDEYALIRLWRRLPKRAKDIVLDRVVELLPQRLRPASKE